MNINIEELKLMETESLCLLEEKLEKNIIKLMGVMDFLEEQRIDVAEKFKKEVEGQNMVKEELSSRGYNQFSKLMRGLMLK